MLPLNPIQFEKRSECRMRRACGKRTMKGVRFAYLLPNIRRPMNMLLNTDRLPREGRFIGQSLKHGQGEFPYLGICLDKLFPILIAQPHTTLPYAD